VKPRVNWLTWSFQFIGGLIVGGVLGFYIVYRPSGRHRLLFNPEHLPLFVCGVALIGAAIASCLGERLWGSSHLAAAQDRIEHNTASRTISITASAIGALLVGYALFTH
jgi:hypothetical protein